MSITPSGGIAVMARRVEPDDSLDWFATPPWATRALCEHVIDIKASSVWEPACGDGIMSKVLSEYADLVWASDVHNYGWDHDQHDFLQPFTPHDILSPRWIITNPPFRLACEFVERGLEIATDGVAVLVRSVWAEGGDRYRRLFSVLPPTLIAQFCERVPMVKGAWDPDATTATSYAWFVWRLTPGIRANQYTRFVWIPSGCRKALTRPDDLARFARAKMAPPSPCWPSTPKESV